MPRPKGGLRELKPLRRQLRAAASLGASSARGPQAADDSGNSEPPAAADDRAWFRQAMANVTPLKKAARARHRPSVPAAITPSLIHRRNAASGRALPASAPAMSAGQASELAPADEYGTAFLRPGTGPDVLLKLRRGGWPIQAELDLHGLRSDPAYTALDSFVQQAAGAQLRCVRVIHGKGYGSRDLKPVLRENVRLWLRRHALVQAFCEAPEREGGAGAALVLLRTRPPAAM